MVMKYYMKMGRYSYKTGGVFGIGGTQHYHHAFKTKSVQDMVLTYAENNVTTVKPEISTYVTYLENCLALTYEDLLAKVNKAIEELIEDGTIDAIMNKYIKAE